MKMTKVITTASIGAAIVVGSMLAVTFANAQTKSDKKSELVEKLATELNVDSAKVQGVFDTFKEENQAERKAKHAEHISSLVANGKLIQEQADVLTTKHNELHTAIKDLKDQNLTREEIKAKTEEARTALEAWAKEQNIDLDDIRPDGPDNDHRRHNHHDSGVKN